jgi:hypothetical protein
MFLGTVTHTNCFAGPAWIANDPFSSCTVECCRCTIGSTPFVCRCDVRRHALVQLLATCFSC